MRSAARASLPLVVAGAGVATYGFVSDKDVWKGVGVAAEAATFFALDAFGSARAVDYEEHVKRFDPSVAFSIGVGAPVVAGCGRSFLSEQPLGAHCGSQNPKLQLGAAAGHWEFCVQGVHVVPAVALS